VYGSRRFWTLAALGGLLVAWALLVQRPAPLLGAAALAAWLLATQVQAARGFAAAAELDVTYRTDMRRAGVDQPIRCRFVVERATPADVTVEATAPRPLAAEGAGRVARTVRLGPGESRAATTFELTFPVAGRFAFGPPDLTLAEPQGLFTEEVERGDAPTVDVTADGPRDIHVGRGGDRIIAAYGEHPTDQRGAGLQPEELREYMSGDPADSIDWKATARLNEPYVREYQAETDRETLLIVDHRATMTAGRGGKTMLAYAREVALGVAASAADAVDPLGLYTVGDEGLTTRRPPATSPQAYTQIRQTLARLAATSPADKPGAATAPDRARRAAQQLAAREDRFATRLRPFLSRGEAYVTRLADDPLFGAVQAAVANADATQWTVLVSSDADPTRLEAAVKLAARESAAVLVFLTPAALFEPTTDIEAGYEQYVAFEELRRTLDAIPRVSAFEVAPGARLQRLLATRRAQTTGS
jgi:uncharacterized protein (DUF58 family)